MYMCVLASEPLGLVKKKKKKKEGSAAVSYSVGIL